MCGSGLSFLSDPRNVPGETGSGLWVALEGPGVVTGGDSICGKRSVHLLDAASLAMQSPSDTFNPVLTT